jgi:phosphoserine phosphatase
VLPSWNDGAAKSRIVEFVNAVTQEGSPDFVAPAERIAVFDNDGTLWSEQPLYFQFIFMIDQLKAAVPKSPKLQSNPVAQALMKHDMEGLSKAGTPAILGLLAEVNGGMSVAEYDQSIREWLITAKHPKFERPYTEMTYAPMRELLDYLRANDFKTFIVSGGSVEFMRPWAEQAYGIPPEQVIGSQQEVTFEMQDGKPVLKRGTKFAFIDDGPGKPVGIYRHLGERPIAAFGNSDGDLQMLQFTMAGEGKRLALYVHHDDAEREFAYDRESHIGRLDKGLDEGRANDWVVVSMKSDWKKIYAFEK